MSNNAIIIIALAESFTLHPKKSNKKAAESRDIL